MKKLGEIFIYGSFTVWVIFAILYWTSVYGGIGFFGSLITLPLSTIAYLLLLTLSGFNAFFFMCTWFLLIYFVSKKLEE